MLRMAGVPLDTAEQVFVQLRGVEVLSANGNTTLYYCQDPANAGATVASQNPCTTPAAPRRINLMALGGSLSEALLSDFSLPAGSYNGVRLLVDIAGTRDSYIVVQGGAEHELTMTNGDQSQLLVNRVFNLAVNGRADMTVVLDLRKSVRLTNNGNYRLSPNLRLVDTARAGSIAGSVSPTMVPAGCSPAVYIFSGSGVNPDDVDGNGVEPISSAVVRLDNSGVYRYRAGFIEAGNYTVSYTCRAVQDRPDDSDALAFSGTANVTVNAQGETTHDFLRQIISDRNQDDDDDDDEKGGKGKNG